VGRDFHDPLRSTAFHWDQGGGGRGEGAGFFPSASRMRDSSEGGEIGVRELEVERGYLFRGAPGDVKRNERRWRGYWVVGGGGSLSGRAECSGRFMGWMYL